MQRSCKTWQFLTSESTWSTCIIRVPPPNQMVWNLWTSFYPLTLPWPMGPPFPEIDSLAAASRPQPSCNQPMPQARQRQDLWSHLGITIGIYGYLWAIIFASLHLTNCFSCSPKQIHANSSTNLRLRTTEIYRNDKSASCKIPFEESGSLLRLKPLDCNLIIWIYLNIKEYSNLDMLIAHSLIRSREVLAWTNSIESQRFCLETLRWFPEKGP